MYIQQNTYPPLQTDTNPPLIQFLDVRKLKADNTFLVMSEYRETPVGVNETKFGKLTFNFDKEKYGYACIENVQCEYCSGADCGSKKGDFINTWTPVRRLLSYIQTAFCNF